VHFCAGQEPERSGRLSKASRLLHGRRAPETRLLGARSEGSGSFYPTKLFAVINEEPVVAAQKSDLIREYRSYLEVFDVHQTVAEAARAAVDTARERGFEKEIDGKFKCSLAYHGVA
jgi:hypothetical protein